MKHEIKARKVGAIVASTLLATLPGVASASGFQLSEYSAESLGRANSGGAAMADDATALAWNPANLVLIDDPEFVISSSVVRLGADFTKISATDALGQPLAGGEGGSVGKLGLVPAMYWAQRLNERTVWGVSFTSPFGLSTDYDPDSIFRYQTVYNKVAILQINPAIGWQVSDNFSLGFGIDFQYMTVKLTQMVDYGTVCFGQLDPLTCQGFGLVPQQRDGYAELEGDGTGWGFNFGATYHYDSGRVGMQYRSSVSHSLDGTGKFLAVPPQFLGLGVFQNSGIEADFKSPELISLSWYHQLNDQWAISADYSYTGWDSFQELLVRYDNPLQPPTREEFAWTNVSRYSFGVDYELNSDWTLRAGYAFDESPVVEPVPFGTGLTSPEPSRSARLPDADRQWISFGASWSLEDNLQVHLSYNHLFLDDDIRLDHTGSMNDRIIGTFEADADIISFQMNHQFD